MPAEALYFKPWNKAYQDWAVKIGLYDAPQPYLFSIWSEPMRKFQACRRRVWRAQQPPKHLREQLKLAMDPLPIWYAPFGDDAADDYPVHALTQRPMAMYHSWGSQNAWLRQIHGNNPLYLPTKIWNADGFADGDWANVTSPNGEITVPVAHMAALNENTVWTWNAIGKRKGAWALGRGGPRGDDGLSAQSSDFRIAARTGRRATLEQFRPGDGASGVVRSAGQDRSVAQRDQSLPDYPGLKAQVGQMPVINPAKAHP